MCNLEYWLDLDDVESQIQDLEESFAIDHSLGDDYEISDFDELREKLDDLYAIRDYLIEHPRD